MNPLRSRKNASASAVRENKFRIELQITLGLNGKVGEKVLFVDVDAAKPVSIRYDVHPADLTDFILVVEGQAGR